MTNAHVVEAADQVTVVINDGRSLPGKVIGTDAVTDVAVVDIEANGLPKEINQSNLGFKIDRDQGVLVVDVAPNSPAARGGLRPGDIITEVKGVQIQNADFVQEQIKATPSGETLQFEVSRNGLPQVITVRPEQLPAATSS